MVVETCPTDVVHADPERIWGLLVDARSLARWSGTRLIEGPARTLEQGDRVIFRAFPGFRIVFEVVAAIPPRELRLDVRMPFGVVNREVVTLAPLGAGGTRVTFN